MTWVRTPEDQDPSDELGALGRGVSAGSVHSLTAAPGLGTWAKDSGWSLWLRAWPFLPLPASLLLAPSAPRPPPPGLSLWVSPCLPHFLSIADPFPLSVTSLYLSLCLYVAGLAFWTARAGVYLSACPSLSLGGCLSAKARKGAGVQVPGWVCSSVRLCRECASVSVCVCSCVCVN